MGQSEELCGKHLRNFGFGKKDLEGGKQPGQQRQGDEDGDVHLRRARSQRALHTVYFWPKKMGSMRRILGTISVAISHFLQNKSDSYNRSVYSTALSLF